MQSKKILYLITLLFLTLTSCTIKGSFQGLYSYYSKTNRDNPNLLVKANSKVPICDLSYSKDLRVLVINGLDFKNCIQNYDEAIIYLWKPKCKSDYCYSPDLVQSHFDREKIELFIVAEYYDGELMSNNYILKRPIYGIDTEYYNTSLTHLYLAKFFSDLGIDREDVYGNFFYFKNGNFINSFKKIHSR